MKPSLDTLQAASRGVDPRLVRAHWERLDERYFKRFPLETVVRHLKGLARLTHENPAEVVLDFHDDRADCTVLAFDYLGEFSLLAGILAGLGLVIENGGVHTYARREAAAPDPGSFRHGSRRKIVVDPLDRRRIVDHFSGRLETDFSREAWAVRLTTTIRQVIGLLEADADEGLAAAKHRVNEMVARRLATVKLHASPVLYPVRIELTNDEGPFTRLKVVSEDTPAFLYALSNALSLRRISIEHIRINTVNNHVEDQLDVVDEKGRPIEDPQALDQIKFSVLLTKQFTFFLDKAPDPFAALSRFEQLVGDVLELPQGGAWVERLSSPRILQDLARLLGASDFLWEDMIRLQYETLLPMLAPHVEGRRFAEPPDTLSQRLDRALAGASTLDEKQKRLNEFKDQEIFRVDLDHLLTPGLDFHTLSTHLTALAEAVVGRAVEILSEDLATRTGRPRTVAGLEAKLAVLGLGKFGGVALGYASDIELLFVYSDQGETDGPERLDNREFFERLVRAVGKFILAKREGIFNLDLRLRPYGTDGPLACSLESFCQYYGPGGPALSYERLALVRLRAVGGDHELGAQVERLRDDFIYETQSINIPELRELRARQFEEKTRDGLNAKFSPGALVDLEYDVQLLQVMGGKDHPRLRTPRIHEALSALRDAGILTSRERDTLEAAYNFLRDLINGLRMLRGSARDLFLPPPDSDEFVHLARRLGYVPRDGLDPARQLRLEFETRTAEVRTFVEHHFGRDSLPGPASGNVADLLLSDSVPEDLRRSILRQSGFREPDRAYVNLRRLAGEAGQRARLARLAVLAFDILSRQPDPDMALNNWERFAAALPDRMGHFERLLAQPMRLEILMRLFSASQFLADTLVRNPEFFDWTTDPSRLRAERLTEEQTAELRDLSRDHPDDIAWFNAIRRFRRRETLRIGTRDLCLRADLESVTLDLSNLADALVRTMLSRSWQRLRAEGKSAPETERRFCLLAFGKLGGRELNYSSDIDLVGVCADDADQEACELALEGLRAGLTRHTEEGYAYRVDLRLRPYGISGQLIATQNQMRRYYAHEAELSEIQALLKARAVAGDPELGERVLEGLRPLLMTERPLSEIASSIQAIREAALNRSIQSVVPAMDVKSGWGGLRDIEFMVQGLQLLHAHAHPDLLHGNTLEALRRLGRAGLLPPEQVSQSTEDYIFLRRVEHYLQILEDQQIHTLPQDPGELGALAKRMLGIEANAESFLEQLQIKLKRVRDAYLTFLIHSKH